MCSSQPVILYVDSPAHPHTGQTLRQHGFTLIQASTGGEALHLAGAKRPALIILDLSAENSLEICRQLKDNPLTAAIPLLLCAETYQDPDLQRQALASRAEGYLTHTTEPLVLLSMVKALLPARSSEAQETLRHYERIVSATTDGLSLVDQNYVYRLVNNTYLTLNDKPREAIVGHPVSELVGQAAFESLIKAQLDQALAGEPVYCQEWITFPTGSRRFMSVSYTPYTELDGVISGVVVTLRDLTELKQAEEALRESQYMLQLVIDHVPQDISWKNQNLVYLGCNRTFALAAGLTSPAEIIGKNDFELAWHEYAEYYMAEDRQILELGQPKLNYQEFQTTSTGQEICLQISKIPLHNAAGNMVGLLNVFEDITERTRTEQALRASEAHSRALLEAIPDMICRLNTQGRCLQVKAPLDFRSIYPFQERVGAMLRELYPPEQADLLLDLARAAIATHETQHAEIHFEHQNQPLYRDIRFAACGPDEALMIVRDITQRKRIEEVLFNTQELLSAFIKYSPALVFVVSVDGRILLVNQAWEQFFDLQQEKVIGRSVAEVFPAEMAHRFLSSNQRVADSLASIKFEQTFVTPANTPYYEEVIKFPIFDATGQIEAVGGIATDITARKEAELQIQRRNRELDLLNRVIAASVKVTEPEILLDSVCRALAQALDLPIAYAGLLNIAKTNITVVAEYLAIEQPSWLHIVIPNPPVHELLFRRAPLVVDIQNDCRLAILPQQIPAPGLVTALVLPLISEGELLGILNLITTMPHRFSAEEINLAWSVADQVAGVLARARLIQAQQLLSVAIEQAGENVVITDPNGIITYVNPAFEETTGYKEVEVLGQSPRILKSGLQDDKFYQHLWETITSGLVWRGRLVNRKKDDTLYTEDATIVPVFNSDRQIINYVAVKRDITAELRLEEQIRQTQKMDAVGRLAGGVAHDFNNVLVIINGYCDLLLAQFDETNPIRQDLGQIKAAAERAAALTRQLLVFSRKQVVQAEVLNLNDIITDLNKMLRRLIREDISIVTNLSPDVGRIKVDRGQLTQVILNLAVNARDAMPNGGTLTLETENVNLDFAYVSQFLEVESGPYILLKVSDTGLGMDQQTLKQIFEPFFTTKPQGEGTGLGLAIVHSIIKQSGGHIEVASIPEQGTTFKIYLPRLKDLKSSPYQPSPLAELPRGSETILVVEDDVRVRELVCLILRRVGYTVLEAVGGVQAAQLSAEHAGKIQLLLTDMVMPDMSGTDLAVLLKREYPPLKVLYMTGYPDRFIQQSNQLGIYADFLQKPFSPAMLTSKIRDILDTP
ncbi:MAG: PAS domain S-box protein [Anaerolineae bacterium]